MITFLDGPAAGFANGLCLRRAPKFLRVVVSEDGTWDALDLLTDTPRPGETIYAYRLVSNDGWVHIRRQRGGGCFVMAKYEFVQPQPDRETLRLNAKWREWATATAKASAPKDNGGGPCPSEES